MLQKHTLFISALSSRGCYRPTLVPSSCWKPPGFFQAFQEHSLHPDCRKASPTLGAIFTNSVFFPFGLCSDHNVQNSEARFCVSFTKGHVIKRLTEGHDPDETEIHF